MMHTTTPNLTRKPSTNKNSISSLTSRSWCQISPPSYTKNLSLPSYEDLLCASVPCLMWDDDVTCFNPCDIEYSAEKYSSVIERDVQDMRVSELMEELEAYGVGTNGLFEKSELAEALLDARKNLPRPEIPPGKKKDPKADKQENILKEIEKVKSMKSSEIRRELREQYNIHTVFFEKAEYANALATARVEETMRIKEEEKSKENNPSTESSFFPSLSGISNTMQNIQTISSLLQNSQQLVNNPEFAKIIQKAQSNPKVMEAVMDCMSNPNNFTKYQSDPEITSFLNELGKCV